MMKRIYLDNAATTPLDEKVLESMLPYLNGKFGNPSSIYSFGRETKMAVEEARKKVAELLNVKPAEIFFTSGGTEATNTAIYKSILDLKCTRIISSKIEHHATTHSIEYAQKTFGTIVEWVPTDDLGHIDFESFEKILKKSDEKTLITLMHANNEIGNLLDLDKLDTLTKNNENVLVHCDMVQTIGHYPIDLSKNNIHFASAAAHKFHGPKGVGILYINSQVKVDPLIHGGAQERNMRAGTENTYGIVGFAKALELANQNYKEDITYVQSLKDYAISEFQSNFENLVFHGDSQGKSLYTVLNIGLPKTQKSDMLLLHLDIKGICLSGGSACSSGVESISHVIEAVNKEAKNTTPIRISFSKNNKKEEIDILINEIKSFLQ